MIPGYLVMIFWNQHNIPYHTGYHKTCLAGFKMAQNGPKMVIKLTKPGTKMAFPKFQNDSQAYILCGLFFLWCCTEEMFNRSQKLLFLIFYTNNKLDQSVKLRNLCFFFFCVPFIWHLCFRCFRLSYPMMPMDWLIVNSAHRSLVFLKRIQNSQSE